MKRAHGDKESAGGWAVSMQITVLVPTYRRPADLERCLHGIERQQRSPDAVVVVCRDSDVETHELLAGGSRALPLTIVKVSVTGVVAALNAGLDTVGGDVVAITDDDAEPRSDWLAKIEEHFAKSPEVGGVGGRDYIQNWPAEADSARVGIIQWFGRQVGNHHIGTGPVRTVDMLKGVNMSFRLAAIGTTRFDQRLRGTGAQVHNELAFCLAIRRKGWRLIYDPTVAVDHYPAQRFDEDQRSSASLLATRNAAYNETLTLLEHFAPTRKLVYCLWAFSIGARDLPGVVQCVRLGNGSWHRLPSVLAGRIDALRAHVFGEGRKS